jgi:hypothetical protein
MLLKRCLFCLFLVGCTVRQISSWSILLQQLKDELHQSPANARFPGFNQDLREIFNVFGFQFCGGSSLWCFGSAELFKADTERET